MESTQMQINRVKRKLSLIGNRIGEIAQKDINQLGRQGEQNATQNAPKHSGALREAITLKFKQYGEVWIISQQPQLVEGKDYYTGINGQNPEYTTQPLPYHVWIETGKQPSNQNHYMRKTGEWLSNHSFNQINRKVKKLIS